MLQRREQRGLSVRVRAVAAQLRVFPSVYVLWRSSVLRFMLVIMYVPVVFYQGA